MSRVGSKEITIPDTVKVNMQDGIFMAEGPMGKLESSLNEDIEVNIEGMTCEIGCAKLIESKIHKLEGVTFSSVNFEHKIGHFSFDSNKISKEELAKNIDGIAGGELYKVTQTNIVKEFKSIP